MAVIGQVGETAGQVWKLLASEGPQSAAQLKKKLKSDGELLSMALGWLAREDKIQFLGSSKSPRIALK